MCYPEKCPALPWSRGLGIIFYPKAFEGWDHICLRSLFTRSFTIKYSESHMRTPTNTHTHPTPISCLIQTCLMSPLTDPRRVRSTHAHRHSITAKQRRPHINPSTKASSRPFPMWMRCPKVLWCYLAGAKDKNVINAPLIVGGGGFINTLWNS